MRLDRASPSMRVAACQLPEVRDDVGRTIALIAEFGMRAEQAGADLVCFPECFLQGYFTDVESVGRVAIDLGSSSLGTLLKPLKHLQPTLVIGLIERSGGSYFNTAIAVREGALLGRYRKKHLLDGEQGVFRAGEETCVCEAAGTTIGLVICYDLNFPTAIEETARAGAKLVACPCNNMMRHTTADKLKETHTAIRRQRALESSVWLLTSDVTGEREGRISYGPTSLIRPDGELVDQVPLMTTGMIVRDICEPFSAGR